TERVSAANAAFGGQHMTSSVGVSPGPGARAPAVRSIWWRSRLDTTPARLRLLLAVLVILSLAWGVVAALTANQHASAAASVVAVSEPLSLDAEQIYQGLSDADATAANAFLAGGLEPAAARQRSASRRPARWWVLPPPGPSYPARRRRRPVTARPSAMTSPPCPRSCRCT